MNGSVPNWFATRKNNKSAHNSICPRYVRLTDQILLARREAFRLRQIIVEIFDISGEVRDRASSNKTKHLHAAVVADPQRPRAAADVDVRLEAANGVDAAVATEPDHQLIVAGRSGVVDVAGGEEVVGDVGADVGVADAPDGGGGHGGDLRDELLAEVAGGVGVALDVVLPAVPLPGGGPGDGGAGGGVEG